MSFLQRTSDDNPFAMTYNTGTWTYLSRPNTKTETWLTASGTNGYSFTGKGFVFGFMSAHVTGITQVDTCLGQLEVGDSSGVPRYKNGFLLDTLIPLELLAMTKRLAMHQLQNTIEAHTRRGAHIMLTLGSQSSEWRRHELCTKPSNRHQPCSACGADRD